MKTKSFYHLPLSSLQLLLTGLFLGAIPLWFQLPAAMIFGFLGCLLWRFILERKGLKCPGLWTRCGVGLVGLLMIWGLHGTLIGLTAGMGLLLLLIALKVLEMRSEREFMLLAYLAFFILLTSLFFSQTLLACFYVGVVFLLLTATVVQFTGGGSEGFRFGTLVRYTSLMVLQALPLIVLLFIFLPRLSGGGWLKLNKPKGAQSGMSDQINPGSTAELAQSEEDAFRVNFPNGDVPPFNQLYWRVAVFGDCQGLKWRPDQRWRDPVETPDISGPTVVQRIMMEPHTGHWIYGLDRHVSIVGNIGFMSAGNVLTLSPQTPDRQNIIVTSRLGNDRTPLSNRAKVSLTKVPDNLSGRTWLLVQSWLKRTNDPQEIAKLILAMFRQEKFRYTLSPGTYSENGIDEFLFQRKLGFCEHYAAAFGTLMRMAGVPTRMVAGYHGGETNPFSDYMIVRQADAHAWVEIWIENEGWTRIDPVDYIDPVRVDPDTPLAGRFSYNLGEERNTRTNNGEPLFVQNIFRNLRLGWDAINFQWNLHIVSYDQASQREFFFRSLGISHLFSWKLIAILLGGFLIFLGVVYLQVRQKPQKKDRSLVLYRNFCLLLSRHGLERHSNEGPRDFSRRAADYFPAHSAALLELFDLFIACRYGPGDHIRSIEARLGNLRRLLRSQKTAQPR